MIQIVVNVYFGSVVLALGILKFQRWLRSDGKGKFKW